MSSSSERRQVVVVGAGQAGLSVAYYLKRLAIEPGRELVVLDRGPQPGGAWQFRWEALRLGTAHRVADLPGMEALGLSFATADRTQPARDVVTDYYRRYEQFYGLGVRRPEEVRRVRYDAGDLVVETDRAVIRTDVLVNATGTWGAPFRPYYPGVADFAGRHVHTADYVSAEEFAGLNVGVIGGGTSAVGFLLELEPVAASLSWFSRRPVEWTDETELGPEAGGQAVARQDAAARAGLALPSIVSTTGIPRSRRIQAGIERGVLTERPMFARLEPHGARMTDGSFIPLDAVIWATGFRPELRHLAPLRLREPTGGISVSLGAAGRDSRIFFAGYGPQASTIGAGRAGRRIARQVVAALSAYHR